MEKGNKIITREEFLKDNETLTPYELYRLIYQTRIIILKNESVLSELEDETAKYARDFYSTPILNAIQNFCFDNNISDKIVFNPEKLQFSFSLFDILINCKINVFLQSEELQYSWSMIYHTTKDVSRASINKIHKLFDEINEPKFNRSRMPTSPMGPAHEEYYSDKYLSSDEMISNIEKTLLLLLK